MGLLTIASLPVAFLLDLVAGDPPSLPHPIRWMGIAIEKGESAFRRLPVPPAGAGGLLVLVLVPAAWSLTALAVFWARAVHPWVGMGLEVLLVYYTLSVRSLEEAAMAVHRAMRTGETEAGRSALAMIVGRDVRELSESGVARAAVETVAENLVDGVLAPLFFAVIGGAPLAMAYKMVNTLDSMVGYKNDRYLEFGRFAARLDDATNFVPARLSVPVIALAAQMVAGRGRSAFSLAVSEGRNHASPNAGFPEAAFAATLGIWMGGPNIYHGRRVEKPYIGRGLREAEPGDIPKACHLMILSSGLWMALLWAASALLGRFL